MIKRYVKSGKRIIRIVLAISLYLFIPGIFTTTQGSTCSIPEDDSGLTARERLDSVYIAARKLASDVQLIYVLADDAISFDGKHYHWLYFFKSASKNEIYEFDYEDEILYRKTTLTTWGEGKDKHTVDKFMAPLPDNWIDSKKLYDIVEANGGKAFRTKHGDSVEVRMELTPTFLESAGSNFGLYYMAAWNVRYRMNEEAFSLVVDAVSGTVYNWFMVNEKVMLPYVDTVATIRASDAELIGLWGQHMESDGKTAIWRYEFRSEIKEEMFQIMSENGKLGFPGDYNQEYDPGRPKIRGNWIDSDSAFVLLEQEGGAEFRETHTETDMNMVLTVGEDLFPVWNGHYRAPGAEKEITVYAQKPMMINSTERLSSVDSMAWTIASDARLVYIMCHDVSLDGTSVRWNYLYKSVSTQTVFQLYTFQGEIYKADEIDNMFSEEQVLTFDPVIPPWRTSREIIDTIEVYGGQQFREEQSECIIKLFLGVYEGDGRLFWEVTYEAPADQKKWWMPAVEQKWTTAGALFDQVDSTAETIAEDAYLVFVRAKTTNESGTAVKWYYLYESLAQDTLFEVWVVNNAVYIPDSRGLPNEGKGGIPIPDDFMDSDTVLMLVEDQGGKNFRDTVQSNYAIEMELHACQWNQNEINTHWNVYYNATNGSGESFMIEKVHKIEKDPTQFTYVTAGELMSSVDSVAGTVASDAELVFIRTNETDSTGTARRWYFVYESVQKQMVFEIWFAKGKVIVATERGIPWISSGQTPIPPGWFDSDSVMLIAESQGGKNFRDTIPVNYSVEMDLHASQPGDKSIVFLNWNVYYAAANGTGVHFLIEKKQLTGWMPDGYYTFGGEEEDYGYSVQQTADGRYLVSGYTKSYGAGGRDSWVIKTDANLNEIWNKTYGDTLDDFASHVEEDLYGNILFAHTSMLSGNDNYVGMVESDSLGNVELEKYFGGGTSDFSACIHKTFDGGFIIAGSTESEGAGGADVFLVKTDKDGNKLWSETYGGNEADYGNYVLQCPDSGFIIVGQTNSFGENTPDIYLVKTDRNGVEEWYKTFGGSEVEAAYSIDITSDTGFIIAGATSSYGLSMLNFWLLKTDKDGNEQWSNTFGGTGIDEAKSVQQTSDGGYILTGTISREDGTHDIYVVKIGSSGNEEWTRSFGGESDDYGECIRQTMDGGYIIAGATNSFGTGDLDVLLVKIDSVGESTDIFEKTIIKSPEPEVFPSPFNNRVTFRYSLPGPAEVNLQVFDLNGRIVTMVQETKPAGMNEYHWDGTNSSGNRIQPGIYFYRMSINGKLTTGKIIKQ